MLGLVVKIRFCTLQRIKCIFICYLLIKLKSLVLLLPPALDPLCIGAKSLKKKKEQQPLAMTTIKTSVMCVFSSIKQYSCLISFPCVFVLW